MRQPALAGWIVNIARVDKRGVAEHRRFGALADQDGKAIGQNLGGDALLEALQVLLKPRAGEKNGRKDRCYNGQPPRQVSLHCCSSGHEQTALALLQSYLLASGASNRL